VQINREAQENLMETMESRPKKMGWDLGLNSEKGNRKVKTEGTVLEHEKRYWLEVLLVLRREAKVKEADVPFKEKKQWLFPFEGGD